MPFSPISTDLLWRSSSTNQRTRLLLYSCGMVGGLVDGWMAGSVGGSVVRCVSGVWSAKWKPVGLIFTHRAGRCRPGRTRFWSPGCPSCIYMECLKRGWVPILLVCGRTGGGVKRGRGPSLPGLPSLYAPQPISERPVGLGFHTVREIVHPGELDFRPRVSKL